MDIGAVDTVLLIEVLNDGFAFVNFGPAMITP